MQARRLGQGVDALFKQPREEGEEQLQYVEAGRIRPSLSQPRKYFDQEKIKGLTLSIKEHGVIQPLVVEEESDGGLRLIAGERRLRAAKKAGLELVPVIVRSYSEQKKREAALVENIQREDLNPVEEAEGIQELLTLSKETQESLAARLGISRTALANTLRLLRLSELIKEQVRSGRISAGHARALLSVTSEGDRNQLFTVVLEKELSVRETERFASLMREGYTVDMLNQSFVRDKKGIEVVKKWNTKTSDVRQKETVLFRHEERLIEIFASKVHIRGTEQRGKIEISYYSQDDFYRVIDLLERDNLQDDDLDNY